MAGCGTQLPASVSGGECKVFTAAAYQIIGKTRFDQEWIDEAIESGVAACGWPRPKERPTNWDQVADYARVVAATPPVAKKGIIQRIKDRFKRKPKLKALPVAAVSVPASKPRVVVAPSRSPEPVRPAPSRVIESPTQWMQPLEPKRADPPPKARDPVDELLDG